MVAAFAGAAFALASTFPVVADGARNTSVGPEDTLDIAVFGDESVTRALSGRFRVGPDGTLFFPMLGRIDVEDMTASEIGELLRQRLGNQIPITLTSVAIAEFAPVFLTGHAARTGPFPYRPDMTVMDLVLLAGGLAGTDRSEGERIRLEEEVASLEFTRFALHIRKKRLVAELEDRQFDIDVSQDGVPAGAEEIIAAERNMFETRGRALASRRSTYEAQKSGYDQEITSVEEAISLHDQEVALIEKQLNARETLAERGFATESTLSELKRLLTSARRDALEFRTALFRARQNRLAADRDFEELRIELDRESVKQLREVELAAGQNGIALAAARTRLERYETEGDAARNALGRRPDYILIRKSGERYETSAATEATELRRGDIVRIAFRKDMTAGVDTAEPVLAGN